MRLTVSELQHVRGLVMSKLREFEAMPLTFDLSSQQRALSIAKTRPVLLAILAKVETEIEKVTQK
jgi:hypothetical protein